MFTDSEFYSDSTLVDVLLPVYNCEAYLLQSLVSIRSQTLANIRVFILNDGSTDRTLEIARDLAAVDPRFVVVDLGRVGLVNALNAGLARVTAPYVARQDADDISFPGRLAVELAFLERNPDICAVSSCFLEMDAAGVPVRSNRWLRDPASADPFEVPAREPYLSHPFLMARTDAIRAVGGYRHIRHSEDADLYWRLSLRGKLANLPEVLGLYRMHRDSISAKSAQNALIQSFFSQLAALSYRRVAAQKPDFPITSDLADDIERCVSVEQMVARIPDLSEPERTYLICAGYAKTIEALKIRSIPVDPAFVDLAIAALRQTYDHPSRNGRRLVRFVFRAIQLHAGQSRRWLSSLGFVSRLALICLRVSRPRA